MSDFRVEICRVEKVENHPNADRLEMVQVKGWNCVVSKNSFSEGDLCLYIPIDSILPEELEKKIFGEDSKIRLDKHRVRTIKLRGVISQGLVIEPGKIGICAKEGQDLTSYLGILKYEPPEALPSAYGTCNKIKKRYINSNFHKYTDISNIKNYPKVFEESDWVSITEKIHGTSVRLGWVKNEANTIWEKVKKLFGLLEPYTFIFGSRNVQLSYKNKNKYYYDSNVYAKTSIDYDLKNKLKNGEILYGEIIGPGIQKRYSYGCKEGETKFYAYDVMIDDRWLDVEEFKSFCEERQIPRVQEIYSGFFDMDLVKEFTEGASIIDPIGQPIREGCVVKPIEEKSNSYIGRKVLKSISSEYLLLKNNSDFH